MIKIHDNIVLDIYYVHQLLCNKGKHQINMSTQCIFEILNDTTENSYKILYNIKSDINVQWLWKMMCDYQSLLY